MLLKISKTLGVSIDDLVGNPHRHEQKTKKDNLETQWPEGVKVLRRAHGKLDDAERKRMLRLINAFIDEVEEEAAKKDKR